MHAKRGQRLTREDLGITFRSKWEFNLSYVWDQLIDKGILKSWQYEPDTYDLRIWYREGAPDYTPDFKLTYTDGYTCYIEVKGFSQGRDRNQMRRYLKRYNTHPLIVVTDSKPTIAFAEKEGAGVWSYRKVEKDWKRLIEEWEG